MMPKHAETVCWPVAYGVNTPACVIEPLLALQTIGAPAAMLRWSYTTFENDTLVSASVVGAVGETEIVVTFVWLSRILGRMSEIEYSLE